MTPHELFAAWFIAISGGVAILGAALGMMMQLLDGSWEAGNEEKIARINKEIDAQHRTRSGRRNSFWI